MDYLGLCKSLVKVAKFSIPLLGFDNSQNTISKDFLENVKFEPTVASCTDGLLFLFLSTKQNPLKPARFDFAN